jgi:hypothetical protein
MRPVGNLQRKPSAHKLNEGVPAIKMMDKIYNQIKAGKQEDLNRYNSLCGPVIVTRTTKVTTKTTKLNING